MNKQQTDDDEKNFVENLVIDQLRQDYQSIEVSPHLQTRILARLKASPQKSTGYWMPVGLSTLALFLLVVLVNSTGNRVVIDSSVSFSFVQPDFPQTPGSLPPKPDYSIPGFNTLSSMPPSPLMPGSRSVYLERSNSDETTTEKSSANNRINNII